MHKASCKYIVNQPLKLIPYVVLTNAFTTFDILYCSLTSTSPIPRHNVTYKNEVSLMQLITLNIIVQRNYYAPTFALLK